MSFTKACVLLFTIVSFVLSEQKMSVNETDLLNTRSFFGSVMDTVKETLSNISYAKDILAEDAYLTIEQMVIKYGYDFHEHKVITADGYNLTIHRIRNVTYSETKKPVFLMHGLIESSESWILQGPNKALAYLLADEGYDVWMGNARGNKYSSLQVNLTNKDPEYWSFSWHEIGVYDLPAMIDYILKYTSEQNLYYIGHSQGTTVFYVMASTKPEYNKKIKLMFSLSPVAYMSHAKSPIVKMLSSAHPILSYLFFSSNMFCASLENMNKIMEFICLIVPRCDNFWTSIVGETSEHIEEGLLSIMFSRLTSSSSIKQLIHYGQLVNSGEFCQYDYGASNVKVYGQETPPKYNLSEISTPIALFYSGRDGLSDPQDVSLLLKNLGNVQHCYSIEDYNHWDFLYASNAKDVIYKEIVQNMKVLCK